MSKIDFQVYHNFKTETQEALTRKIFYNIFVKRLKGKKPVVVFISGDSGEGKSYAGLTFQEIMLEIQGIDYKPEYIDLMNCYTPLQYPEKLRQLLWPQKYLENKEIAKAAKKINVLAVHEARTLIKSKKWQDFTNQAVGDVNAMSRSIKRMMFIIISQFIRDINTDVRYTLNFYCSIRRPIGKRARLYIDVMWKDDRDLEKPKLRKRKLTGIVVDENGRYRKFTPQYFELSKPRKETIERFEKEDFEAKGKIIHATMEKMIKEMKMEANVGNKRVDAMVDWYSKNVDQISLIGKRNKRGWSFKKEVKDMHDLTKEEFSEFKAKMESKLATYQNHSDSGNIDPPNLKEK